MKPRDEKVTKSQKEYLVDFMERHLDLAKGNLLTAEGKSEASVLWAMLAQQLNNIGPEKSVPKWQRVWTQLKTKIKRKAIDLGVCHGNTGDSALPTPLTDVEERIINIISKNDVNNFESLNGASLDNDEPSLHYQTPSTSFQLTDPLQSWVKVEIDAESSAESINSNNDTTESLDKSPIPKKKLKTADEITNTFKSITEENHSTSLHIVELKNEVHDVKNILNNIFEQFKNINKNLERIACAMENKK